MPYVLNEGARLYWTAQGEGIPILLIMGLSFTHEMWFRVLPWLSPGHRLILFDNRGMGRSDVPPGPYLIRQLARDAAAVMDAAGVPAAHIAGASMGGMIAQELALRQPDRVLSLILGCSTYSGLLGKWPHFRRGPNPLLWRKLDRWERERALRRLLYSDTTPLERIEEDLSVRSRCCWTSKGFLNQLAGILMWSSYSRLPRIKAPTLVIHGAEDHLIPPSSGKVLASRIPGARFHLVPDAGHILLTDQPEVCRRFLTGFLHEQTSAASPAHVHFAGPKP